MRRIICLMVCILLFSCGQPSAPKDAKIIASGLLSTKAPEFGTSVNAAHDFLVFNRTTPDRSKMWIMYSNWDGDAWSLPDTLPFSTGQFRDVDAFLTEDGSRLYFSSNRPVHKLSDAGEFNTWYIDKEGDVWSDPINPGPPLNSDSTEIFISVARSGNAYFVSERGQGRTIMVSKYDDGRYLEPENIELKLRGENIYASNPCISSDEKFLIVAARDPQGSGAPDLFASWNEGGVWSELVNLGEAVNTPFAEFAPGLSKDDQVLYFTSERPGVMPEQEEGVRPPGDIYKVDLDAVFMRIMK